MNTMEDRMSKVERTLAAMADISRELHAVHLQLESVHLKLEAGNLELQAGNLELQDGNRALQAGNRALQDGNRALQAEGVALRQEMRDADRRWGALANKMGTLVEDIVAPGIPAVFRAVFGLERLDADAQRVRRTHRSDPAREREFDYVVAAGDLLLITETKSTVRPEDIPALVTVLQEARDYLPEAGDRHIVGALAGFSVHPGLVAAGERQGLLMFGLGTGLLRVLNTDGFQPARF